MKIIYYITFIVVFLTTQSFGTGLIANAGSNKTLNITPSNKAIHLDASKTTSDTKIVSYKWYEGNHYIGSGISRWYSLSENGKHTITLRVIDNTNNSSEDNMTVIVKNGSTPSENILIADAGENRTIDITSANKTIQLDGSGSSSNRKIVSYKWYIENHFIDSGISCSYLFSKKGTYKITLKVTDNQGMIAEDNIIITVIKKIILSDKLTADAGSNKTLNITPSNKAIHLDGSGSGSLNTKIISYKWYEGNHYIGSGISRWYSLSENGKHTITLKVRDNTNNTSEDNVTVIVKNGTTPSENILIADAGENRTIEITSTNKKVHLDGSGSSSSNTKIVNYKWFEGNHYIGAGISQWYPLSKNGEHNITLKVTDNKGAIAKDSIIVTVIIKKGTNKITQFNKEYDEMMLLSDMPRQETFWGFQEINITDAIEHNISSFSEYQDLLKKNNDSTWKDHKTHIINFAEGEYIIPKENFIYVGTYAVLYVPSQTIIQGAGIGKTKFIARSENIEKSLFNIENSSDVVLRNFSFYNETTDNKWKLLRATTGQGKTQENFLFENIEFDDSFGAIGQSNQKDSSLDNTYNFITLRGLRKRINNTTNRIQRNDNINTPIPNSYQFRTLNNKNITLAGQLGIRTGNSVIIHDCILGDNISATLDIYANYVEIVGVKFINPLHDHSIKSPKGNHLYIHDSTFELTYDKKIIQGLGYWNPTFFTHEMIDKDTISFRKNYHFKNLKFKRSYKSIKVEDINGVERTFVESEPFTIYDEHKKRRNNVSGDMVWENISFEGYSPEHQIVGYPNVQTSEGYKALNYTSHIAKTAQIKAGNNNSHGTYSVDIIKKEGSTQEDIEGVYSWGQKNNGTIDYPRDNRLFAGSKNEANNKPYIKMYFSTLKDTYNNKLKP